MRTQYLVALSCSEWFFNSLINFLFLLDYLVLGGSCSKILSLWLLSSVCTPNLAELCGSGRSSLNSSSVIPLLWLSDEVPSTLVL